MIPEIPEPIVNKIHADSFTFIGVDECYFCEKNHPKCYSLKKYDDHGVICDACINRITSSHEFANMVIDHYKEHLGYDLTLPPSQRPSRGDRFKKSTGSITGDVKKFVLNDDLSWLIDYDMEARKESLSFWMVAGSAADGFKLMDPPPLSDEARKYMFRCCCCGANCFKNSGIPNQTRYLDPSHNTPYVKTCDRCNGMNYCLIESEYKQYKSRVK